MSGENHVHAGCANKLTSKEVKEITGGGTFKVVYIDDDKPNDQCWLCKEAPVDYRDDLVTQEEMAQEFEDFYLKSVDHFERQVFSMLKPTHAQRATLRLICEICYFKGSSKAWKQASERQAESSKEITQKVQKIIETLGG